MYSKEYLVLYFSFLYYPSNQLLSHQHSTRSLSISHTFEHRQHDCHMWQHAKLNSRWFLKNTSMCSYILHFYLLLLHHNTPPTNRWSDRVYQPKSRTILTAVFQSPSRWLGRMAAPGWVQLQWQDPDVHWLLLILLELWIVSSEIHWTQKRGRNRSGGCFWEVDEEDKGGGSCLEGRAASEMKRYYN